MINCTINGQSAVLNLSNQQLQVLLTGKFGDGHLTTPKNENENSYYSTNCIYKEYIEFKKFLLGDLALDIKSIENNGYKKGVIYTLITHHHPDITKIRNMSIEEALSLVDDLGLALWFYDDGSLHKTKLFYNLNTQKYSEEINTTILAPFLKKFNITAKPTIERKKDGREFWYLRISKFEGAYEISKILSKYNIACYDYKIWDSETILKWSKLQAKLKSVPTDLLESMSAKMHSSLLEKDLSVEDIVRTLVKAKDRLRKRQSSNI